MLPPHAHITLGTLLCRCIEDLLGVSSVLAASAARCSNVLASIAAALAASAASFANVDGCGPSGIRAAITGKFSYSSSLSLSSVAGVELLAGSSFGFSSVAGTARATGISLDDRTVVVAENGKGPEVFRLGGVIGPLQPELIFNVSLLPPERGVKGKALRAGPGIPVL